MTGPAHRDRFLAAKDSFDEAKAVLFGCPFDGAATFRRGAAQGPEAIRSFSDVLETYSPELDADLEDVPFFDMGDLSLPCGGVEAALGVIRGETGRILSAGKIPFGLGGDHLVSFPMIEAVLEAHPDLVIFQWDAHADLREEYEGAMLSHATVMRRVVEKTGAGRLVQFGIRSGTREEWRWIRQKGTCRPLDPEAVHSAVSDAGGRPVYLTLDLDVLDPSEFPGTGTPEPGGARFIDLMACIAALRRAAAPIVGLDVVELAPRIDPTGASAIAAAKTVRELLLTLPA